MLGLQSQRITCIDQSRAWKGTAEVEGCGMLSINALHPVSSTCDSANKVCTGLVRYPSPHSGLSPARGEQGELKEEELSLIDNPAAEAARTRGSSSSSSNRGERNGEKKEQTHLDDSRNGASGRLENVLHSFAACSRLFGNRPLDQVA